MALVADIYWNCPKCSVENTAQAYRDYHHDSSYDFSSVPLCLELSWNQPCKSCKSYILEDRERLNSETPKEIKRIPI
jgi:hypothetical protein